MNPLRARDDLGQQALKLLEQAYQERFGGLAYRQIELCLDSLRTEGRFIDLLRRAGPDEPQ
jgi:hypothetical protein